MGYREEEELAGEDVMAFTLNEAQHEFGSLMEKIKDTILADARAMEALERAVTEKDISVRIQTRKDNMLDLSAASFQQDVFTVGEWLKFDSEKAAILNRHKDMVYSCITTKKIICSDSGAERTIIVQYYIEPLRGCYVIPAAELRACLPDNPEYIRNSIAIHIAKQLGRDYVERSLVHIDSIERDAPSEDVRVTYTAGGYICQEKQQLPGSVLTVNGKRLASSLGEIRTLQQSTSVETVVKDT